MTIQTARSAAEFAVAQTLFREYVLTPGVSVCAVGFEEEVAAIASHYFLVVLAVREGEALGCGALRRFDDGRAELKRLYVRESARGSGAGRALLTALIDGAKAAGYRSILLDTLPSMTAAIRMYEGIGFVRRNSYSPSNPKDALCYELALG